MGSVDAEYRYPLLYILLTRDICDFRSLPRPTSRGNACSEPATPIPAPTPAPRAAAVVVVVVVVAATTMVRRSRPSSPLSSVGRVIAAGSNSPFNSPSATLHFTAKEISSTKQLSRRTVSITPQQHCLLRIPVLRSIPFFLLLSQPFLLRFGTDILSAPCNTISATQSIHPAQSTIFIPPIPIPSPRVQSGIPAFQQSNNPAIQQIQHVFLALTFPTSVYPSLHGMQATTRNHRGQLGLTFKLDCLCGGIRVSQSTAYPVRSYRKHQQPVYQVHPLQQLPPAHARSL